MKKMLNLNVLVTFVLMSFTQASYAQNLEIKDGPTSYVSPGEIKRLNELPKDWNNWLLELRTKAKSERDPSEAKRILKTGIESILSKIGPEESVWLTKDALGMGINLSKLIEELTIKKGPSKTPPGIVRQQVRILMHSVEMAINYYRLGKTTKVPIGKQWAHFGKELSDFIIKMSDGVLSVSASYGMIRWGLGVLANKLSVADNSSAFSTPLNRLVEDMRIGTKNEMPDLMRNLNLTPSDHECFAYIKNLKNTARMVNEQLKDTFAGIEEEIKAGQK